MTYDQDDDVPANHSSYALGKLPARTPILLDPFLLMTLEFFDDSE